jgi:hypothetical protein
MKNLIERLRNDTLDDISDTALEAADALERLTMGDVTPPHIVLPCSPDVLQLVIRDYGNRCAAAAVLAGVGDVALPKTQWLGDIPGFTITQLKDYGDRRAAAAVLAERERCVMACETTQWSSGIDWWRAATKREIAIRSAKECASAIRKGTL